MRQPVRCKGFAIGILGGLLWALLSYCLIGAIDWTGAVIFALLIGITSSIVAHWRLSQIR